jgi:hypothetical protein
MLDELLKSAALQESVVYSRRLESGTRLLRWVWWRR